MTTKSTLPHIAIVTGFMLSGSASAQDLGGISGPAKPAITRYIQQTKIPCYKMAGETTCLIKESAAEASVFYGSLQGDPTPLAVAFVLYQYDTTGNAMDQMAIVFKEVDGQWKAHGRADNTIGSQPRQVEFGNGVITYTGTVVGKRDNRANPTGKARYQLKMTDKGVAFSK